MGAPAEPAQPVEGWRTAPLEIDEPGRLLARSDALLDGLAEDPTPRLRWYRSTRTAIVLGRGQRRLERELAGHPIVVHRSSGGGAVLLAPDLLCLDVALPPGHPWLADGDLHGVFAAVGRRWAAALAALGVPEPTVHGGASTTPRGTDVRSSLVAAICYASLGRGEVTVAGRKLVGLSQRRRRHGTLVQCGLLRRWQPRALLSALGGDPEDVGIGQAAVGLDEILDPSPSDAVVLATVNRAFTASA